MKKKLLVIGLPLALVALVVILVAASSGGPGTTYKDGSKVGKVLSDAAETATFETRVKLGAEDPEHEVDHVYDALAPLPGVARVEIHLASFEAVIAYDAAAVTPAQISGALQAAGYADGAAPSQP